MNKETLNAYNNRLSTNNDTITNINSLLKRLPVGGEDLTEELTDYDTSLTTQETSIQDIIKALEGKAAGGGGGNQFNIFIQEDEPEVKEGIWFQEKIEVSPEVNIVETVADADIKWTTTTASIPYSVNLGVVGSYNGYAYLIGGGASSYRKYVHKINLATMEITRLTDAPSTFGDSSYATIGKYIYIFGGGETTTSKKQAYKYDMTNNTFTALTSLSKELVNGCAVAAGTDIYLLGSNSQSNMNIKYDTINNTYQTMSNIPSSGKYARACLKNNNIYIFGGYSGYSSPERRAYKYNISDDTYTTLSNAPVSMFNHLCINYNNTIFLIGNEQSGLTTNVYVYDSDNNTYSSKGSLPFGLWNSSITIENDKVYTFGGSGGTSSKAILEGEFLSPSFGLESGVIICPGTPGSGIATQLCAAQINGGRLLNYLTSTYIVQNNATVQKVPTYYGNGTEWIKFIN